MTLLAVENLSKDFGGVRAVEGLSFTVEAGAIHSIIGPNGAGKTTLFNLITGLYVPTVGAIAFDGRDITHARPHVLPRLGISRTFQNLQIFYNMTALENVMAGSHLHAQAGFLPSVLRLPSAVRANRRARERAAELMDFVGLAEYAGADSDSLPYGALKRLEIARALATEPRLLLLDEPAAGCNPRETRDIDDLIKRIAAAGVTVLLVEHDMHLVMGISDRILVLDYGRRLAEGTAEEVRGNPDVIAAYLGGAAQAGEG